VDARTKALAILFGVMTAAIFALVIALAWQSHQHQVAVTQLQNELATRDKTIEVQKNLYTKLTVQTKDIQGTLDQRDKEVKLLEEQIKKQGQELLNASSLVVSWKKAYEGLAKATQTHVDPDPKNPPTNPVEIVKGREKVDFHQDFGYIGVDGWTLTNPPQAWVRVKQNRPLRLTLALSQDKDKAWHTYTTSSEENIGVDIAVTSVNPYLLQPKWYEKIGIAVDLGAGTNQSGIGALVGVGLNYQFMQFTLGPHVWLGINNTVDKYYGLSFEWRPFQRK
jgi:hypothetical protein